MDGINIEEAWISLLIRLGYQTGRREPNNDQRRDGYKFYYQG